jgi:IclR family acetate operon transcriptional repressor
MPNNNTRNTSIQSVENACKVLEMLVGQNGTSISELSEEIDLSKSTIHNHLNTLTEAGYVAKRRGEYQLGLQCLTLGGYARDHHKLHRTARSAVDHLAQETGELALVTTHDRGKSIYLYQVRGADAVTTDSYLGIRLPLHCTATGKAMLAYMEREQVEEIIDQEGLPEQTENTITDPEQLFEELNQIQDRRVALDNEERILGMRGIASPVIKRDSGEVMGALSITGPISRLDGPRFTEEIPELIRRNAEMLEVNITYS